MYQKGPEPLTSMAYIILICGRSFDCLKSWIEFDLKSISCNCLL